MIKNCRFLPPMMMLLFLSYPALWAAPAARPLHSGSPVYNERHAAMDLRTILAAQTAFHAANNRYAENFDELTAPAANPPYLDGEWKTPRRGYVFNITPKENAPDVFDAVAEPWKPGATGNRRFFIDQSGVIRSEEGKTAGAESPPLAETDYKEPSGTYSPPEGSPGFLRGALWRLAGYQPPGVWAVVCLRTIVGAEVAYHAMSGRYAQCFEEMTEATPAFLDRDNKRYTWPVVEGCRFTFMPVADPKVMFIVIAEPEDPKTAGTRWLLTDASGVIRWSDTADIGPDSPPIGESRP